MPSQLILNLFEERTLSHCILLLKALEPIYLLFELLLTEEAIMSFIFAKGLEYVCHGCHKYDLETDHLLPIDLLNAILHLLGKTIQTHEDDFANSFLELTGNAKHFIASLVEEHLLLVQLFLQVFRDGCVLERKDTHINVVQFLIELSVVLPDGLRQGG